MLELLEPSASRRRSVRRAVSLETEVTCDAWDGAVSLRATDLSPTGAWLETCLPLDRGDRLRLRLTPPGFKDAVPLTVSAQVARVGLYRRRAERARSGMGLVFDALPPAEAERLAQHLRGLPPPLPRPAHGAPPRPGSGPAPDEPGGASGFLPVADGEVTELAPSGISRRPGERCGLAPDDGVPSGIILPDGTEARWVSEAPLLTAGRPSIPARQTGCAEVIPLPTRSPLMRSGA